MIAGPDGAPSASYGELVAGQRRVERVPADAPVTPATAWRRAAGRRPARLALRGCHRDQVFPSDLRLDGMLHGGVLHPPSAGATLRRADTARAAAHAGRHRRQRRVAHRRASRPIELTASRLWPRSRRTGPSRPGGRVRPIWPHTSAAIRCRRRDATPRPIADWRSGRGAGQQCRPARCNLRRRVRRPCAAGAAGGTSPLRRRPADGVDGDVDAVPCPPGAGAAFGVDEADVHVIVPDFGGGFGGKHGSAVALEAARLARAAGRPVKVQWSRVDEFSAGYLRPAAVIDVASSADRDGTAARLVVHQYQRRCGRPGDPVPGGEPAAALPARRVPARPGLLPRAGGDGQQLRPRVAHGRARRRARRGSGRIPAPAPGRRAPGCRAASGCGRDQLAGRCAATWEPLASRPIGTGIALGIEKDGRVATAARVHVGGDGRLTILSLVTAVDCGAIVHPDGLTNQVEGAVVMGLGAGAVRADRLCRWPDPERVDDRLPGTETGRRTR